MGKNTTVLTNFREADLHGVDFGRADLTEADLSGADLTEANLSGADLTEADLNRSNLRSANVEASRSLLKTNLHAVTGLTKEQLERCKAKGAIIDEDSTVSLIQSTVSTPPPLQNNKVQAQSAPSAQGSIPAPDASGSSAASSNPSPKP